MRPKHLEGMNADDIMNEVSRRIFSSSSDHPERDYQDKMREIVHMAIEHALLDASDQYCETPRSITFLNTVLSKEKHV